MNKRILVIDDDEDVRKSFVLSLEDSGYGVDTAESGEKGVEKVKAVKYDLIYLDLKMPGMGGVAALRERRKINTLTPIYIITAFYEEFFTGLKKAARGGMNFELLKKPIESDKIVFVTRSILEEPGVY